MKTIKNSKDITTLEVGDLVVFGNLEYRVSTGGVYFLTRYGDNNDRIFKVLHLNKRDFVERLGIDADCNYDFPEVKSLEALTAIVSALFKEYEKQNGLPKTWEEFCKKNPIQEGEYLISTYGDVFKVEAVGTYRDTHEDRNYCTSKQEAEAFLALIQLRQLRKCYVKDWEPDLGKKEYYGIVYAYNSIKVVEYQWNNRSFSFPTYELAKQFLTNFKDLLEIAKPLL